MGGQDGAGEWRSVDELRPLPGNPRRHTPEQVRRIAALVERFGWGRFGSPWPALLEVAKRRRVSTGQRLAIVTTDGGWRATRTKSNGAADRALVALWSQPPRTLREMRPAAETGLVGAASMMGARVVGLSVAGYTMQTRAAMGYAVALLVGE